MTEWEKLKKEYKELPIPSNGPHQVQEAIKRARKKRIRWQGITRYGTVAAAVFVVLLLPGILWLSGGLKSDNYCEDFAVEESASKNMSPFFSGKADGAPEQEEPLQSDGWDDMESGQFDGMVSNDAADNLYIMSEQKQTVFWAAHKEAVSAEIVRQMKERMQNGAATYYVKSEAYPEGFELLSERQSYYINEEGFLVVVFEAGTVAPKEQGDEEFVIPKEVAAP